MFNFERPLFRWFSLVVLAGVLVAAGVIPAVIPQSVPPNNKTGNGTRFALSAISSATAGDTACFDANSNLTNVGCTGGGAGTGGLTVYSGAAQALAVTTFLPFGGGAPGSTTEADVSSTVQVVTTLSKLGVSLSAAPGVGQTLTFLLRDNMAGGTALTCAITGAATSCADTTHSATTVAGHVYDFRVTPAGTVAITPVVKITMLSGAVAPAFSVITSGTNTAAAMVVGTGASLTTSGTGTITANGLRAYTVATLPAGPVTGSAAYVTDGNSTSDCVTGTGSNKVLCVYNGAAWAFPGPTGGGGGGSFVLVESHTASNSAALNFTTCISSTYDDYQLEMISIQPATDATAIHMQVSTDGGSTYDTTSGHYAWNAFTMISNTQAANGSTSDSAISFTGGGPSNSQSFGGTVHLYNPLDSTLFKLTAGVTTDVDTGGTRLVTFTTSGTYAQAAAYNAFRILAASGNLTSGTARCYGLAH